MRHWGNEGERKGTKETKYSDVKEKEKYGFRRQEHI